MILFLSFLLLIAAPASLLWVGRLIAGIQYRDKAAREVAEREAALASADAWYRRPMMPAFAPSETREDAAETQALPETEAGVSDEAQPEWFLRPMRPLVDWSALRRVFGRRPA